jgi:hypothetical protein
MWSVVQTPSWDAQTAVLARAVATFSDALEGVGRVRERRTSGRDRCGGRVIVAEPVPAGELDQSVGLPLKLRLQRIT